MSSCRLFKFACGQRGEEDEESMRDCCNNANFKPRFLSGELGTLIRCTGRVLEKSFNATYETYKSFQIADLSEFSEGKMLAVEGGGRESV